jgi:multidrug efflux pump subunit AcrB
VNRALFALALASCGGKSNVVDAIVAKRPPIVITVVAPGFSPADVETGIVSVIEPAIADIPGIAHIRSESRAEQAWIAVELAASADPIAASDALRTRVSSAQPALPPSISSPIIELGRRPDTAVLRYTLSGPFTLALLRETAAHTIARPIEATDGVATVDVCGGAEPAVMIYADSAKLAGFNVTVTELETALKPGLAEPMTDLRALGNVEIAKRGGATIRLGDVAILTDNGALPMCHAADEQSEVAIEGVVYTLGGVDPATVRARALAAIEKVRATLPPGMVLNIMPEDKPAALLGLTIADIAPAARLDQLVRVRDALLAAGARHVVVAEGDRDQMTGLAETDIEIRIWPATVEQTVLVRLAEVPGLVVARADAKMIGIRGPELATLRDLAGRLAQQLTTAGVGTLGRVGYAGVPRLEIRIDRSAASDLGVPVQTISESFRVAIGGIELGSSTIAGKREPVTLTADEPNDSAVNRVELLQTLMVRSATGGGAAVPISQVASFLQDLEPATIYHVDRKRWVGVRISGDAVDAARKVIEAFATPPGYRIEIE